MTKGVTGKFFWGGKVIFPDFFPGVKCLFPSRKFPFWYTKNKFLWKKKVLSSFWNYFTHFEMWKAKKKKKRSSPHLGTFPSFHFQVSFFSSPFSIFSLPLFPGRSTEISQSEVSGALCPPHLLRHCVWPLHPLTSHHSSQAALALATASLKSSTVP